MLDRNDKSHWKAVAKYMANFLSNLSVVGIGLAIFREEQSLLSCAIAFIALVAGAFITLFISKKGA